MLGLLKTNRHVFVVFAGLGILAGCGDEGNGGTGAGGTGGAGGAGGTGGQEPVAVEIQFEARVGAEVFNCGTKYAGLGSAKSEMELSDFRLYIHDVTLMKADGTVAVVELEQDGLWQYQNLALLDFENKAGACANGTTEINTKIKGKAPPGPYAGVSFVVGVPFALNHGDAATAPSPLNLTALFWSWNEGYKFMRVDGAATGAMGPFLMHLGSTACNADAMGNVTACDRPNRPTVDLMGFDPLVGKVVIDYAALVSKADLSKNAGGAPGCMSGSDDPECASTMGNLGIHVVDGSIHADEQTVFRGE